MAHFSHTLKSYTNTSTIPIYTAGYTIYYANPTLTLYVQFLKDLFGPNGFLNTTVYLYWVTAAFLTQGSCSFPRLLLLS